MNRNGSKLFAQFSLNHKQSPQAWLKLLALPRTNPYDPHSHNLSLRLDFQMKPMRSADPSSDLISSEVSDSNARHTADRLEVIKPRWCDYFAKCSLSRPTHPEARPQASIFQHFTYTWHDGGRVLLKDNCFLWDLLLCERNMHFYML